MLRPEQKQLAEYMSDLSERSYCAGWMDGLEYALWNALTTGARKYGFLQITDGHIARLKALSDDCGGWIIFDDQNGESFVPMDEWLRIYESESHLPNWVE